MEKELQKIQYPRGTQDYSKSRMRENRKYGSVRGGQSNLIPSTRLPPQLRWGHYGSWAFWPIYACENNSGKGDVKNFVFLD